MDPFTMNFKEHYSSIYNALIEIFGKEFTPLIKPKFDNICYVPYINMNGIYAYYRFLLSCKSKELTHKFFKVTGVDTSKHNINNYADELPEELKQKAENLLGGDFTFEPLFNDAPGGFKAFIPRYAEQYTKDYVLEGKLKFINEIKRVGTPTITIDNYEEFTTTEEYRRIESMAYFCHGIYSALQLEMDEYISTIKHYKEYYEKEIQRKRQIQEEKRIKLYKVLEHGFKGKLREHLESLSTVAHRANDALGSCLEITFPIEYFGDYYEDKLNDPNVEESDKEYIKKQRMYFMQHMGTNIIAWDDNYDEIIKRKDVKEYLVYSVFANEVTRLRKYYLEEANTEHLETSEALKKALEPFLDNEHNRKVVFGIMNKLQVCTNTGSNNKCKFNSIIYYTIRDWQCGCMDFVLIHEIIHAIETTRLKKNEHSCGFETNVDEPEMSPYNHREPKRKYERLNEVITDMLAIEVTNNLHNNGIYFLDTKETALTKLDNFNTRKILKDAVSRFYKKYREYIIESRIKGDISLLTNQIGQTNFEEFNDVIDHIDYLIEQGLEDKLKDNELDDIIVIEYFELLKQLDIIYLNMEETFNSTFDPYNPYTYKKKR